MDLLMELDWLKNTLGSGGVLVAILPEFCLLKFSTPSYELGSQLDALVRESVTIFGRYKTLESDFLQTSHLKFFLFAQNFLVPEIHHF